MGTGHECDAMLPYLLDTAELAWDTAEIGVDTAKLAWILLNWLRAGIERATWCAGYQIDDRLRRRNTDTSPARGNGLEGDTCLGTSGVSGMTAVLTENRPIRPKKRPASCAWPAFASEQRHVRGTGMLINKARLPIPVGLQLKTCPK